MTQERKITITAKRRPDQGEGMYGGGFCQEWIDGENEKVKFKIMSGAGLGNTLLSLHITFPDGESFYEDVSITKVATTWVNAILDERKKT